MRALLITLSLVVLAACGRPEAASSSGETASGGQVEGPPVSSLSHEQLQSMLAECMRYGKMDDPRVKYTSRYCSGVMSAHLQDGYGKSAPSAVDPSVTRLH